MKIFGIILSGLLLLIGFRNRWIFSYKFEPVYLENLYYHSQWNIPNSTRTIGDEGLYQYAGWRYANGDNPFDINYMVPPLGKWFYGLGAKYFGNPYFISVAVYLLSLGFYALISKKILKKEMTMWAAIFIFVMNPMLIAQIRATMLDMIQMLFLLGQIYFLFMTDEKNKKWTILTVGVFLGLITGVKIGLFIPIIGLVDLWYLLKKWGYKSWFRLGVGVMAGYVLSYFCYFIQHPNPIPWLRLHEKVLEFWKGGSGLPADPIGVLRFTFLNQFMGWWEGSKMIVTREWTPIFSIGLLLSIWGLIKIKKITNNPESAYLIFLIIGWFGLCAMIGFWPRYLIPIVPVLCLVVAVFADNKKWFLLGAVLLSVPFMITSLENSPEEIGRFMCNYVSTDSYRESYRLLSPDIRNSLNEEEWIKKNREVKAMIGAEKSQCKIETEKWKIGQRKNIGKMGVTFFTRNGEKRYYQGVELLEIGGEWKVNWQWDEKQVEKLKQDNVIEKGKEWRYVWIVPEQIQNWPETVAVLTKATEMSGDEIWKKLQQVVPDKYPIVVGWIKEGIKEEEYRGLTRDVAVRIEKRNNPIIGKQWNIKENGEEMRWLISSE